MLPILHIRQQGAIIAKATIFKHNSHNIIASKLQALISRYRSRNTTQSSISNKNSRNTERPTNIRKRLNKKPPVLLQCHLQRQKVRIIQQERLGSVPNASQFNRRGEDWSYAQKTLFFSWLYQPGPHSPLSLIHI